MSRRRFFSSRRSAKLEPEEELGVVLEPERGREPDEEPPPRDEDEAIEARARSMDVDDEASVKDDRDGGVDIACLILRAAAASARSRPSASAPLSKSPSDVELVDGVISSRCRRRAGDVTEVGVDKNLLDTEERAGEGDELPMAGDEEAGEGSPAT